MSTILKALQKNKFDQPAGPISIAPSSEIALHWKVAFSSALVIIIALLSILIYLLLNPRGEHIATSPTEASPQNAPTPEWSQPSTNNNLVKVTFETKPLPIQAPKIKKVTPLNVTSSPTKKTQKQANQINKPESQISIEDVPNALKKRFALAELLIDIEQNENPTDEISEEDEEMQDGSDIREMSTTFQNKVPLILYDSHMYSSSAADRWIRINGEVLKEGDFDSTGQLEILEIQPQRSIFRLQRQSFSLESLTDWKGY
jgi:general secretion pathway protein B